MGISTEQRAWLKGLGDIVGEPADVDEDDGDGAEEAGDGARDARVKLRRLPRRALADLPVLGDKEGAGEQGEGAAEQRFGFGPEDILPVIPDLIDGATDRRATCAIHNNTQQVLKLDTASLDETDDDSGKSPGIRHGKYITFPPSQIAASDQSGRFVAENNKVLVFSTTGVEATLKYILDSQGTAWVFHFENPFGVAAGTKNSADARVEGPNAAQFETPKPGMSGKNDVKYLFILNAKGGTPPPGPGPAPGPAPGPNVPSSCQITVINETALTLIRAEAEHERGDFMVPPPRSVPPGDVINFVSVETPGAKEQGCKGFVVWEVGSPTAAVWRVEWDNPEGAKNNSVGTLTPQTAGFRSQDVIGQGEENVPVSFTISGGPAAPGPVPPGPVPPGPVPPGPVPPAPVPPPPETKFEPPAESKQPTLRKGDTSADGWVEYAQKMLNVHVKANLAVNGDFDSATHAAVLKFQTSRKLQVDGVIGNQTWAALREDNPEPVGTDGRAPHTFVEKGVEARWVLESQLNNRHEKASDLFRLAVESVGDQPLDPATEATVRITAPGSAAKVVTVKVGPHVAGEGAAPFTHEVRIEQFRVKFPSNPVTAPVTEYLVEAFMPKELGGDFYSGKVREV